MKQLLFGALIVAAASFSACTNDVKTAGDNADTAAATSATTTPEVIAQPAVTTTPATTDPAANANTNAAPGNSAPANPTVTSSTPQVQVTPAPGGNNGSMIQMNPQASTTPSDMKGKPNPPHGQPGHSCAIPVGAPLP